MAGVWAVFIRIVAFFGLSNALWNRLRKPLDNATRAAEIARLEMQRDRLLDRAPRFLLMARMIVTPMFAIWAVWFIYGLTHWRATPGFFLVGGVFGLITGQKVYRIWINPPAADDKWGIAQLLMSDDGETPQSLQSKIDRLRAGEDR
jgi:hypothetical protein